MEGNQVVADVSGSVSASKVDAELPVISKERWEEMRRLRAAGQSLSEIARLTGVDRKTVRAGLRKADWVPYQRLPLAESLLSTHAAWLAARAPQVQYSAQVLFQELRAQRGYTGGYDTVKIAVRPLRVEAAAPGRQFVLPVDQSSLRARADDPDQ